MGTTKIWAIKDSLSRVLDYASNPKKTVYTDLQKGASLRRARLKDRE